jgi:hypothetical protein
MERVKVVLAHNDVIVGAVVGALIIGTITMVASE